MIEPDQLHKAGLLLNQKMKNDRQTHELVILFHRHPDREEKPFEIFFKLGDTESVDARTFSEALWLFANEIWKKDNLE